MPVDKKVMLAVGAGLGLVVLIVVAIVILHKKKPAVETPPQPNVTGDDVPVHTVNDVPVPTVTIAPSVSGDYYIVYQNKFLNLNNLNLDTSPSTPVHWNASTKMLSNTDGSELTIEGVQTLAIPISTGIVLNVYPTQSTFFGINNSGTGLGGGVDTYDGGHTITGFNDPNLAKTEAFLFGFLPVNP